MPLTFDDLFFSYGEKEVLHHLSFQLEKYAVIGESDNGKSTLAKIIMKRLLYEKGSIRFDEVELSEISPDDLYQFVAQVSQNVFYLTIPLRITSAYIITFPTGNGRKRSRNPV